MSLRGRPLPVRWRSGYAWLPGSCAASPAPRLEASATDVISRTVRTDVPLPDSVTEEELRLHAAEVELRAMRDRVRHLEQALHCVAKVVKPYAGGNGR